MHWPRNMLVTRASARLRIHGAVCRPVDAPTGGGGGGGGRMRMPQYCRTIRHQWQHLQQCSASNIGLNPKLVSRFVAPL